MSLKYSDDEVRCWAWGIGWDSTAGLIRDVQEGRRVDLITSAIHGGEKRKPDKSLGEEVGTYEFFTIFSKWLVDRGYPEPVPCYTRIGPETQARYSAAVSQVLEELELPDISQADRHFLGGIYGNMVANETMPGIAFSVKSCSIRHKLEAQEPI